MAPSNTDWQTQVWKESLLKSPSDVCCRPRWREQASAVYWVFAELLSNLVLGRLTEL